MEVAGVFLVCAVDEGLQSEDQETIGCRVQNNSGAKVQLQNVSSSDLQARISIGPVTVPIDVVVAEQQETMTGIG